MIALINKYKKDAQSAISEHWQFFRSVSSVKEIYSFGFSFSDVDIPYIQHIARNVDRTKVTWYFDNYTWNNERQIVEKIKDLGFMVSKAVEW